METVLLQQKPSGGLCALLPYEDRVRKCDLGEHMCSELQFERFSP